MSKQGSVTAATHREVRRENRRLQARVKALESEARWRANGAFLDKPDPADRRIANQEQCIKEQEDDIAELETDNVQLMMNAKRDKRRIAELEAENEALRILWIHVAVQKEEDEK